MPKPKRKQTGLPVKPVLLVVAVMCLRAAASQPAQFTPGDLASWIAGALAAGLLAYAGLALVIPGAAILQAYAKRSLAQMPAKGRAD